MFCPKCGKQVVENSKFCIYCGERVDVPSVDGPPLPSFSGTSGSYRVPGTEGITKPLPTPGPYGDVRVPPDSDSRGDRGKDESSTPVVAIAAEQPKEEFLKNVPPPTNSEAPRGRKSKGGIGVVVVFVVIAVIWAVSSHSPNSTQAPTGTTPTAEEPVVEAAWIDYSSSDGSFAAKFPSTPQFDTSTHESYGISAVFDVYTCDTAGELPMYGIAVYKFPLSQSLLTETEARNLLDGIIAGMATPSGWSSLSSSPLTTRGGFFTTDFVFKGIGDNSGLYMIGRVQVKYNTRCYAAFLMSDTAAPSTRDMFLGSFQPK